MKINCNDTHPTHDIPANNLEGTNFLQIDGKRKGGADKKSGYCIR